MKKKEKKELAEALTGIGMDIVSVLVNSAIDYISGKKKKKKKKRKR